MKAFYHVFLITYTYRSTLASLRCQKSC